MGKGGKAPTRPSLVSPPPGVMGAEDNVKPPPVPEEDGDPPPARKKKPPCPWTEHWDPDSQNFYYVHQDGRDTWYVPEGEYWKNDQ